MGLTRSSSGLLERDEFSSDTGANYNQQADLALSISGGKATAAANKSMVRSSFSTCKAVTVYTERGTGNRASGAILNVRATADPIGDLDGYVVLLAATAWSLGRLINGAYQMDASTNGDIPDAGNYVYLRIWDPAGTDVYGRFGTSTLGTYLTYASSAYAPAYGGVYFCNQADNPVDWVEFRTGVLITCSGLPSGYKFEVSDGTTTAVATESGGTATIDAQAVLFPLTQVRVLTGADAEVIVVTNVTYADMGGGDAFAYVADATGVPFCYMINSRRSRT